MTDEEEFEEWFRPQDPEPILPINPGWKLRSDHNLLHREWTMRLFSAKLAYLAAKRRDKEEMERLISRVKELEKELLEENEAHNKSEAESQDRLNKGLPE